MDSKLLLQQEAEISSKLGIIDLELPFKAQLMRFDRWSLMKVPDYPFSPQFVWNLRQSK